jgi:hypothetical protein
LAPRPRSTSASISAAPDLRAAAVELIALLHRDVQPLDSVQLPLRFE